MHISIVTYGLLLGAIALEALATSLLEKSDGLTRTFWTVLTLACYAASFALSARILRVMPVGMMYALWCGIGISLVAVLGYFINGQTLDRPALIGLALITAGVVVIYRFSGSVA